MPNNTILELKGLTKRFGDIIAVNKLTIPSIKKGEFITFLGPSGCGKTTLLRMIGGFYYPTEGDIIMDGKKINDIAPEKRRTSMVFQNYALFPHMSVFENIAYGLRLRKVAKDELNKKIAKILSIVQLEGLEHRKPNELSGGQQQRVALARCIVIEPEVVLLDEPLSNLDASLRIMMRDEIRRIQQKLSLTTIFVTHDQEEAMSMSDRIVVMNQGHIEQIGTPTEIYENPGSLFVSCFIGHINLLKGKIVSKNNNRYTISTNIGEIINDNPGLVDFNVGDSLTIIIRPESACLLGSLSKTLSESNSEKSKQPNNIKGKIENFSYIGYLVRYWIKIKGLEDLFILDVSNPMRQGIFKRGEEVLVSLPDKFQCIKER